MRKYLILILLLGTFSVTGCHLFKHHHPPGHDPYGPGASEDAPGHDPHGPGNSENAPGHNK